MSKMNLMLFAAVIFCIHEGSGQQNFGLSDNYKSPRSLSLDGSVKYTNNLASHGQRITVEETPDAFEIKKPATQDKNYSDFLSFLYRGDKAKSKVKREINHEGSAFNGVDTRGKRMIIFRPLFVYKQQEIKRQKVEAQRTRSPKRGTKRPPPRG